MKNKITLLSFALVVAALAGGSMQVEAALSRESIREILKKTPVTGSNTSCDSRCSPNDSIDKVVACAQTHCPSAVEKAKTLIG